jgi:hypothetical protein
MTVAFALRVEQEHIVVVDGDAGVEKSALLGSCGDRAPDADQVWRRGGRSG